MSNNRELKDIINNKNNAINDINTFLDNCITSSNIKYKKKADLLSFWLKDYIKYIEQEENFDSTFLKEYKRGDIIKVNLGFNIGNEEGGLHYCVVLDKKNAKSHSTLTVIPLSSQKDNKVINPTSVFLGDEIYQSLKDKNKSLYYETEKILQILNLQLDDIYKMPDKTEEQKVFQDFKIQEIKNKIIETQERIDLYKKIALELSQMKAGTIALVNQVTTISKQRIYNPKKDFDILSGIRLSKEKMSLIDEKIKKLYIS